MVPKEHVQNINNRFSKKTQNFWKLAKRTTTRISLQVFCLTGQFSQNYLMTR